MREFFSNSKSLRPIAKAALAVLILIVFSISISTVPQDLIEVIISVVVITIITAIFSALLTKGFYVLTGSSPITTTRKIALAGGLILMFFIIWRSLLLRILYGPVILAGITSTLLIKGISLLIGSSLKTTNIACISLATVSNVFTCLNLYLSYSGNKLYSMEYVAVFQLAVSGFSILPTASIIYLKKIEPNITVFISFLITIIWFMLWYLLLASAFAGGYN